MQRVGVWMPFAPDETRNRVLKREKPADLLVQAPNKYALALNLKWGRRCLVQRYSAPRSTWDWIGQ